MDTAYSAGSFAGTTAATDCNSCGWTSELIDFNFPPPVKTPIGEWFKAYRRNHSILLYDIAAAMDIKPSELSAIACRGRLPSLDELSKLARAFSLSPEETGEMLEALTCSRKSESDKHISDKEIKL